MTGEDKRTVHGYRIIHSMIIGSQEMILGEKQAECPDKRYLCAHDDHTKSILGKFVVIKAEVFRPEYQRANEQTCYVIGGSGAKANPKEKAIIVKNVYDGREAQFERSEVQGLVNMKYLPEWAQKAIKKCQKKESIRKGAAR